ncbi:YsnF/AvaK domain-containing protein [Devosia sp. RR2S18]|uniref:YsnF/AvaK domain-containing protein n=1 Tax=Devosia rhizosphaerae TaxID=3049774 RepID=UPI002541A6B3|nr:YsnF/AvaK domain-containing protein [Devosia sp. RR2S18]WIJ24785.1 YsnF/AvaK domain-containing protein [Devosia sp. RR2S18]
MSQIYENGTRTLTAFFDTRSAADGAVERLVSAGIPRSQVQLAAGAEQGSATVKQDQHKGFFESLSDFFMPEEDRYTYAEGLSRGGYLVVVNDLDDRSHEIAIDILDDEGSVNLDEREATWRAEGWGGYDAAGTTSSDLAAGRRDTTGEAIPVVEEQLEIGKRDVSLGRVRVRSYVREQPVSADVNLHEDRVTIDRRPVDRPLTGADDAFRDRTIEAEEHAERAVVSKEARVTEEISLRREGTDHVEKVGDTVRKTEVEIEDDRNLAANKRQNQR